MSKPNYILEYYNKIKSGEIPVSKKIDKQYEKIVDELHHPKDEYIFDINLASKPIEFIETFCKNSKAPFAGQPVKLLLWQKAMIQSVYGFVDIKTHMRRCRQVFILCGRKNGKSTLTSGIALYGLIEEHGAQVICAATKREQAMQVFTEAKNMVMQSPYLQKHIRKRKSDLYLPATMSTFMPLASQTKSLDGLNVSLGIIDECHAIKDRELYDIVLQSQSARSQPLMIAITTSGFVREGLYDNLYEYASKILDGQVVDDSFLSFFYEMDNENEIENLDLWIKANPSLGVVKSFDTLKSNVERMKNDISFKGTCLTKDFNIPSNKTDTSWLPFDIIQKSFSDFNIENFKGSYAIGGMDLSSSGDLTALTLILQYKDEDVKYIYQHYFLPKDQLKTHKADGVPYSLWSQQGYLSFCEGNKIKQEDVIQWWVDCVQTLGIVPIGIGYDRWGATYIKEILIKKGFKMEPVGQGFRDISPAMQDLGLEFCAGHIVYNNPILKWCLINTQQTIDPAGNVKFDKSKNRTQRIDGAASLITGWKVLIDNYDNFQNMIKPKGGENHQ